MKNRLRHPRVSRIALARGDLIRKLRRARVAGVLRIIGTLRCHALADNKSKAGRASAGGPVDCLKTQYLYSKCNALALMGDNYSRADLDAVDRALAVYKERAVRHGSPIANLLDIAFSSSPSGTRAGSLAPSPTGFGPVGANSTATSGVGSYILPNSQPIQQTANQTRSSGDGDSIVNRLVGAIVTLGNEVKEMNGELSRTKHQINALTTEVQNLREELRTTGNQNKTYACHKCANFKSPTLRRLLSHQKNCKQNGTGVRKKRGAPLMYVCGKCGTHKREGRSYVRVHVRTCTGGK